MGADFLAGEYRGMGRWDGRNARDRTSMGLLLEPAGGTTTNGDSSKMRVPPSVTKYDLHHGPEGGNGIVFETGSVLAAPPTAYIVGLTAPALMPMHATP